MGPHESMTCGVHGIYLKFGSFNGIDPIVPKFYYCFHVKTEALGDKQHYYKIIAIKMD